MAGAEGQKGGKAEWKAIIDLKSPVAELSNKDEQKQVEASGDLGTKGGNLKMPDARHADARLVFS